MAAFVIVMVVVLGYLALVVLLAAFCGTTSRAETAAAPAPAAEPVESVRDPETGRTWIA